jgi:hypothetical protein
VSRSKIATSGISPLQPLAHPVSLAHRGDPDNTDHHTTAMKDRICSIFAFLLPTLVFAAILTDGFTLQTAHHSGSQTYIRPQ